MTELEYLEQISTQMITMYQTGTYIGGFILLSLGLLTGWMIGRR